MRQIALLALLAAAVLFSSGCGENRVLAHSKEVTPVRAYRVDWAQFQNEEKFAAVTEAETQLDLAFRAGGVVTSLYQVSGRALEPGDRVPQGALLARLRTSEYRARVEQAGAQFNDATSRKASAEANVREAQAAFEQADADFSRAQSLFNVQAMTRADWEAARARYEAQKARLAAAQTGVAAYSARMDAASAATHESEIPLEDATLRAPFPAVVIARKVERDSTVAPGTVAYTLVDLRRVKVTFGIPDTALTTFTPGTKVHIFVSALPAGVFAGNVIAVSPQADASTRLFRTTALIDNANGTLRAGLVATVTKVNPTETRELAIPLRAVRRLSNQDEGFAVLRIHEGVVQLQPVKLGPTLDTLIAVTGGLAPGNLVAEDGGMRLDSGDAVKVVE